MSTPAGWYPDPTNGLQERWWNGEAWGDDVRPLAPQALPPPAAPAEVPHWGRSWAISDEGKNGTVSMGDLGLERLTKKLIGKDDRQFIPYSSIQFVEHDRKKIGRDVVVVHVGGKSLEWKVARDAEGFVDAVNHRISK